MIGQAVWDLYGDELEVAGETGRRKVRMEVANRVYERAIQRRPLTEAREDDQKRIGLSAETIRTFQERGSRNVSGSDI